MSQDQVCVEERTDVAPGDLRAQVARRLRAIRWHGEPLVTGGFAGVTIAASTARALIRAGSQRTDPIVLDATVRGDLRIDRLLAGSPEVDATVAGDLVIAGSIAGCLTISGFVDRRLVVSGQVDDAVVILGGVRGAAVLPTGVVRGDLVVGANATVRGDLAVFEGASVHGHVVVAPEGLVDGYLDISGSLGRSLQVEGDVSGTVLVSGSIGADLTLDEGSSVEGDLEVSGSIGGRLEVAGRVGGWMTAHGSVGGDVTLSGSVGRGLALSGRLGGRVSLTPRPQTVMLLSVRGARFAEEVFVGDRVRIDECDFRQCPDLDKLHLVGGDLFTGKRVLANPPAGHVERVPDRQMATIYRQLRNNLETRKNRPAAGAFYRGEMNARRADAWQSRRYAESVVLTGYRLMSGFGLRAWPPVVWFVSVALAGAVAFHAGGLDLDKAIGDDQVYAASFAESLLFTLRTMLSFFSPPDAEVGVKEQVLQLGLRFVGPVLLAQVILAVRERVAR